MDSSNPPNAPHGQGQQRAQPAYDINHGGHYGASAALSAQGYTPVAEFYTGTWANVNQGLHGNYKEILTTYWQHIINHLETETHDYKLHQLPLARIKKVMKADPEVKMISAEAPILFAKGCDIFITELTMRAWIHAEENKRRTLQRSDIASALNKSDMFDFLIDIVPREEATPGGQKRAVSGPVSGPVPPHNTSLTQVAHTGHMPPEYMGHLGGGGNQEDYGQRGGMYAPQVQPGPGPAGYGGPTGQIYGEMEGIYGYPPMQAQQQSMYQVPNPNQTTQQQQQSRHNSSLNHDPSVVGTDPNVSVGPGGHSGYGAPRESDADADGERDYEVG